MNYKIKRVALELLQAVLVIGGYVGSHYCAQCFNHGEGAVAFFYCFAGILSFTIASVGLVTILARIFEWQ